MSEETKTVDEELTEEQNEEVQEEIQETPEEETQEEKEYATVLEAVQAELEKEQQEEEKPEETAEVKAPEEEANAEEIEEDENKLPVWIDGIQTDPHDADYVVTAQGDRIRRDLAEDAMNWVEKRDHAEWIKKSYDDMTPEEVIAKKWGQREGFGFYNKQKQQEETVNEETGLLTSSGQKAFDEWKSSDTGQRLQKLLDKIDPPETQEEQKQQDNFEESINALAEKYDNGDITREQFLTAQTQMVKEHLNSVESELTDRVLKQVEAKTEEKEKANEFRSWFEKSKKEGDELAKNDARYREAAIENVGNDGMTPIARIMFSPTLDGNGEVKLNRNRNPLTGEYYTSKTAYEHFLKLTSDNGNGSGKRLSFTEVGAMPNPGTPPKDAEEPDFTDEQINNMDLKDILKAQGKKMGLWNED